MTSDQSNTERKNKLVAIIATLSFHAILIILLMYFIVGKPNPPLTASEGMVVNLGTVDESTGDIQPMSEEEIVQPIITQKEIKASQKENEKIVTQSIEESEAVKTAEKIAKAQELEKANTENETKSEEVIEKPVTPVALYKGKTNKSTSQGNSDKGTGDQGNPNGDPFSKNYGEQSGTGNTPGGGGNGKGISHTLLNRKGDLIKPQYTCNETGKVVVEIIVDKEGRVVRANAGIKGSTTASTCLYAKAKEAALKTKFNSSQDASDEQRGTITYYFSFK